MEALIIANRTYDNNQSQDLIRFVRKASLIATCNFGFIQFSDVLQNKFYLTPHINVSVDPQIIIPLDELTISGVTFYHSENHLDGYTPEKSIRCPLSGWWDSGTHAILTIIKDFPFISVINAFGFSDGAAPNFYFRKSRIDALSKINLENKEIRFINR